VLKYKEFNFLIGRMQEKERLKKYQGWLAGTLLLVGMLGPLQPVRAQEACLLVPVPLTQRVQASALIVEARVQARRGTTQDEGRHIVTENELEVFKVFAGQLPVAGPVRVITPGGTLGLRREEVSNSPELAVGEQAVFFLEPDPQHLGAFRCYAGPQGVIAYDLQSGTAAEPFARYASITDELYAALAARTHTSFREVRANEAVAAGPAEAARGAAVPVVTGLSPTALPAGTNAVLTISGTGFGDVRGTGRVGFLNANNGGASYTYPLAADYVSWTDTQIQVRVPSSTSAGGPAGTGLVQVTNNDNLLALSAQPLTVTYALSTLDYQGTPYRVKLVNDNAQGGYTLSYTAAFRQNTAAAGSFQRALTTWACATGANRVVADANTTITANAQDGTNVVGFDDATELPAGVLGTTYSYYSGCGSPLNWALTETDYIFDGEQAWQFGPADPTGSQFDFETVALHEQGHGIQLGHIIQPGAVMHYAISARAKARTLEASSDVAAGNAEVALSLVANSCGAGAMQRLAPTACATAPLPVELTAFEARHEPGRGTQLIWRTASERNSAFFAVETRTEAAASWQTVHQQPAAGSSSAPRTYNWLDTRPLAGRRYYRLRQQDLDGTVAYSAVQMVSAEAATALAVYPNPATELVRVQAPASSPPATLRLLDMTGRAVRTQPMPTEATLELRLDGLQAGVYLLEWRAGSQVLRQRLVKR
jgi:hypothetical protein